MMLRGVLRVAEDDQVLFWCPGCKQLHGVGAAAWQFNGNYDAPSFSPSILVTSGHYAPGWTVMRGCWCTFNEQHPVNKSSFKCFRCHSFVKAGMIEFLGDCTHALAGKTVRLEVPPV